MKSMIEAQLREVIQTVQLPLTQASKRKINALLKKQHKHK